MRDYQLHVFKVPVKTTEDWRFKEKCLLRAAQIISEPYLNKARNYMVAVAHKISVDPPNAEPRISLVITGADTMELIVRVPVNSGGKGRIEQAILRLYLEYLESPEKLTESEQD